MVIAAGARVGEPEEQCSTGRVHGNVGASHAWLSHWEIPVRCDKTRQGKDGVRQPWAEHHQMSQVRARQSEKQVLRDLSRDMGHTKRMMRWRGPQSHPRTPVTHLGPWLWSWDLLLHPGPERCCPSAAPWWTLRESLLLPEDLSGGYKTTVLWKPLALLRLPLQMILGPGSLVLGLLHALDCSISGMQTYLVPSSWRQLRTLQSLACQESSQAPGSQGYF